MALRSVSLLTLLVKRLFLRSDGIALVLSIDTIRRVTHPSNPILVRDSMTIKTLVLKLLNALSTSRKAAKLCIFFLGQLPLNRSNYFVKSGFCGCDLEVGVLRFLRFGQK